MLLFGALPLFFMELSLGQFAKSGPINIWDKICPPLKGIGYCFVLISWYVSFYYNVIIAWTTNYVIKTLISGWDLISSGFWTILRILVCFHRRGDALAALRQQLQHQEVHQHGRHSQAVRQSRESGGESIGGGLRTVGQSDIAYGGVL